MDSVFYGLLDAALSEIRCRAPGYLSRFPLAMPRNANDLAVHYASQQACAGESVGSLEEAILAGFAYFVNSTSGGSQQTRGADDPLAEYMCQSVVDAFRAKRGTLPLHPCRHTRESPYEIFARSYDERRTPSGVRYFLRSGCSGRWLLLVNATGTPLEIWSRFLGDTEHDFGIIVPERRGGDLFAGGLQRHVELDTECEDLGAILDAEEVGQVDLLAWCNGATLATALAIKLPGRISSVVLLTPMFKGVDGIAPDPSPFERDLQPILDTVRNRSDLAPFLAETIAQQAQLPDWTRLLDPSNRVQVLLGMPPADLAKQLLTPMSDGESLINVSQRVATDEAYPLQVGLSELCIPVFLIMGSHDRVINNAYASAVLRMTRGPVLEASVNAGGHYIQDLQYPYFRLLLTEFLGKVRPLSTMARVESGNR
jgi:pimeloyl-ACP methyl ester carboxylesterase